MLISICVVISDGCVVDCVVTNGAMLYFYRPVDIDVLNSAYQYHLYELIA